MAIRRVHIYREVLSRIEAYIRDNHLQAGDRLPSDRQLAQMLGVSRPSVRQAIKVLEGLGRILTRHGSGTYVREPDYAVAIAQLTRGLTMDRGFLRQLESVRNAIEMQVLTEAFGHRSRHNLALLRKALEASHNRVEQGAGNISLDFGFEASLGEICANEPLRRLQLLLHELWLHALVNVGQTLGDKLRLHQEHIRIFELFKNGDLEAALEVFRRHLRMTALYERGGAKRARGQRVDRLPRAATLRAGGRQ